MLSPNPSPRSDAFLTLDRRGDAKAKLLIVFLAIASWIAFFSIKGGVTDADATWHSPRMILRLLALPVLWFGIYRASRGHRILALVLFPLMGAGGLLVFFASPELDDQAWAYGVFAVVHLVAAGVLIGAPSIRRHFARVGAN